MRRPRVGEAAAVTAAVAVLGIGAATYEKAQSLKIGLPDRAGTYDGRKISKLMHAAAIKAGEAALATAIADGGSQDIHPDKHVKNGIEIVVTASDGKKTYDMLAGMLTKKDGEPDPSTTYEVLIDEYRPDSTVATETVVLGGGALGGHRWDGVYKKFSPGDQKHPAFHTETYSDPNLKIASDIADILKEEAGLISVLPPGNNSPEPDNGIIV